MVIMVLFLNGIVGVKISKRLFRGNTPFGWDEERIIHLVSLLVIY
jgi:hypothetical protein